MKYLIGFFLCLTSAAFGGDGVSSEFESGNGASVRPFEEPTPKEMPKLDVLNNADGSDTEGAIEEEWKPRLVVRLQTSATEFKIVREAYREETDDFGAEPQVKYRERKIQVSASPMTDTATLYCDSITLNVSEDGDNASFELRCETRISLHYKGGVFASNAATFHDGKCELADATFTHNGMTAKADKLVLTLPVHGVTTNKFGTAIPDTPLMPTRERDTFNREFRSNDDELYDSRLREPDDETVRIRSGDAKPDQGDLFDEAEPSRRKDPVDDVLGLERRN